MLTGSVRVSLLLSQRESLVKVKFFDLEIFMIFDISELPESKNAFSRKCVCVCGCARMCVYVYVGACVWECACECLCGCACVC